MTGAASGLDRLTPREREIAQAAASGAPAQELAAQLFLSPRTVETHLIRIYRKLGLRSRAELVALVLGDQRRDELAGEISQETVPVDAPPESVSGLPQVAQDRRKLVTLLYCAVTNSDELGETLDTEVLRRMMNAVYDACQIAIERHHGAVERLFGDAVLAAFGVATAREDDALRAVRAAVDIHKAVGSVSADSQSRYGVSVGVRIGINTGEAVVGAQRADESIATSNAINVAGHVDKASAAGATLIGEMTRQLVADWVDVEELPTRQLPARAWAQPAYRLVEVHERKRPRQRTTFVGRQREAAVLKDALARVIDNQASSVVTLIGEAGLGKTRLVSEFVAAAESSVTVLSGRCLSYGEGITFWPIVEIVRSACSLDGSESADIVEARLSEFFGDHTEAASSRAQLSSLLVSSGEPGSVGDVVRAVVTVIERLASRAPVVLCVDDVHWAEPVLLDLIEALLHECGDLALLVVVEARPEFVTSRPTWGSVTLNATTLRLEPLSAEDSEVLVGGLGDLSDHVAAEVLGAAGGNPLYLEQLTAHARNAPIAMGSALVVPPTLTALLTARLDQLDGDERALVSDAAVIGQAFRVDELASLSGRDADIATLLDRLIERQIVRRDRGRPGSYRFQHVLVQQAAYDAHPKEIRAERHRSYARWLADHPEEAGGELAALRGWHLEQTHRFLAELSPGEPTTLEVAVSAADALSDASRARSAADPASAVSLLRRAVALTDDLLTKLRRLIRLAYLEMFFSISLNNVAGTLADAEALTADHEAERTLLAQLRLSHKLSTDATARYDSNSGIAASAEAATEAIAWLWGQAASARLRTHELQAAGAWAAMLPAIDRCIAFAEAAGERSMRNEALRSRAAVIRWGPTPAPDAVALLSETMQLLKDEPEERDRVQMELAVMHALMDDGATARSLLPPPPPTSNTVGYLTWAFCRASIDEALGDEASAACVARDAAEVLRASGDVGYSSTLHGWAAVLFALVGDTDQATQLADVAREGSPEDDPASQGYWRLAAALVAASEGDGATAERLVAEALNYSTAHESPHTDADSYRYAAIALRSVGRVAESAQLARQALELYQRKSATVFEPRCLALLGPGQSLSRADGYVKPVAP